MAELSHEVAKAAIDDIVACNEYEICYEIYDMGFTSPDAVQDAIENLKRKVDEVVERLRSFR